MFGQKHDRGTFYNDVDVIKFDYPLGSDNHYVLKIYGRDSRRDIPHFHVELNGKTIACLKIEKAEYFDHGYTRYNVLSDDLLQEIDRQLDIEYYYSFNATGYEKIVANWNIEEDQYIHPNKPDYTKTTIGGGKYVID